MLLLREGCLEKEVLSRQLKDRYGKEIEDLKRELAEVKGLRTAERVQPEPESDSFVEVQQLTEVPTYREPLQEMNTTNNFFFIPKKTGMNTTARSKERDTRRDGERTSIALKDFRVPPLAFKRTERDMIPPLSKQGSERRLSLLGPAPQVKVPNAWI